MRICDWSSDVCSSDLVDESFPLYFAINALGLGVASYLNSQLVMRYGMHRLSVLALAGLVIFAGALLAVAAAYGGVPPFGAFMPLCFLAFCCNGVLFAKLGSASCRERVCQYV